MDGTPFKPPILHEKGQHSIVYGYKTPIVTEEDKEREKRTDKWVTPNYNSDNWNSKH